MNRHGAYSILPTFEGGNIMASRRASAVATTRRNAALKAWETRRAAARKRSLAAKKAWRTRRRNSDS